MRVVGEKRIDLLRRVLPAESPQSHPDWRRLPMPDTRQSPRALTVRRLLAAGVFGDFHVVAGESALDRTVTDVLVTDRCDLTTPVSMGQLIVLDARGLQPNSYVLDVALRSVSDGRGSGLVAVNPASATGIATRRLAERFGTALVEAEAPNVLAAAAAARELVLQPSVYQASMMSQLLRGLARPSTVSDTLALVTEALGRPCSLVEASGAVIAGPHAAVQLQALRPHAHYAPDVGADGGSGMVCPVVVVPSEPVRVWLVCLFDDADDAVQRAGLDLLGVASWAVGSHLVHDRLAMERDARHRLAVLNEVVGSSEVPDEAILAQMATFGWSAAGWVSAYHVQLSGVVDSNWVLANSDALAGALSDVGIDGALIERTDGWSGWVCDPDEPPVGEYQRLARSLRDALATLVANSAGVSVYAGVGRPATGLQGLRAGLTEARQAASLAGAGGSRLSVRHIDELGIQRIMLGWYGSVDFGRVVAAFLEPLVRIDPDGSLLRTLQVYQDCQSSPTGTAAALGVHRNTVMRRIDRIAATLRVDLDDPDQRLALQLVVRMHRIEQSS